MSVLDDDDFSDFDEDKDDPDLMPLPTESLARLTARASVGVSSVCAVTMAQTAAAANQHVLKITPINTVSNSGSNGHIPVSSSGYSFHKSAEFIPVKENGLSTVNLNNNSLNYLSLNSNSLNGVGQRNDTIRSNIPATTIHANNVFNSVVINGNVVQSSSSPIIRANTMPIVNGVHKPTIGTVIRAITTTPNNGVIKNGVSIVRPSIAPVKGRKVIQLVGNAATGFRTVTPAATPPGPSQLIARTPNPVIVKKIVTNAGQTTFVRLPSTSSSLQAASSVTSQTTTPKSVRVMLDAPAVLRQQVSLPAPAISQSSDLLSAVLSSTGILDFESSTNDTSAASTSVASTSSAFVMRPQLTNGLSRITAMGSSMVQGSSNGTVLNGRTTIVRRIPATTLTPSGPFNIRHPAAANPASLQSAVQLQMDDLEEDDNAMGIAETYAKYSLSKLKIGRAHPDPVVESASMASVEPPDITYRIKMPEETVMKGKLSCLQLETITYVGQKHECFLPDGSRAGFLIGDGAGVGKGRTIAGIIYDNYKRKRKKAIWVSSCNDLKYDAERDLADIGANKIKVRFLSKTKYAAINSQENNNITKGVLFATYSALIGESSSFGKYNTRLKQILDWCGPNFDGCIIFDECHRAKNLCPVESGKPTKTGLTVLKLQNKLPLARIVYASATGASEPKNMAYMVRLGLWGVGTPFKNFPDFISTIEKRGVGAMELVAMDMKLRGMYIARQLSFAGVSFRIEEAPLTSEFKALYNDSVRLWVRAKQSFTEAADLLTSEANAIKTMWGQFWSAHQRFFKYMCIASKVDAAVKLTCESLKHGRCVVIGLQSTGEARTQEQLEKEDFELNEFVSSAKGVLEMLVEKHFPASNAERVEKILALARKKTQTGVKRKRDGGDGKRSKKRTRTGLAAVLDNEDSQGYDSDASIDDAELDLLTSRFERNTEPSEDNFFNALLTKSALAGSRPARASPAPPTATPTDTSPNFQVAIDRARELRNNLLRQIKGLGKRLPPNTLDHLVDQLGGPEYVAEMTGRKKRLVQSESGNILCEARAEGEVNDLLNFKEKERFLNDEKKVAIISEAASSGISLHSDVRVRNQRRRVHITLELPWSADRAIQQFGRTHRSNQVNAPEYVFLISELAGERRFASIVAKRLESMGALTHGDRRTADTRDLSSFNVDNSYGRDALERTLSAVMHSDPRIAPPNFPGDFFADVKESLVGCGLCTKDSRGNYCLDKDATNVSKFLNRILGVPVDIQNALFHCFTNTLTAITTQAKKAGKYDTGILDLCVGSDSCKVIKVEKWSCQHSTGVGSISLHQLQVERGMNWVQARNKADELFQHEEGFYLSKKVVKARKAVLLAVLDPAISNTKRPKSEQLYSIYKPNLGILSKQKRYSDLLLKFEVTSPEMARRFWEEQYTTLATTCSHVFWTGSCTKAARGLKCDYGQRTRTYHVLCGSVLSVWSEIENLLINDPLNSQLHRLQVVRFQTSDKLKYVGTLIPNNMAKKVYDFLHAKYSSDEKTKKSSLPNFFENVPVEDDDDDIIMLS
ncbi:protein strawberry notch homolog 1 [Hyalella azteca]|uniref:Protein strawberry notch homolog 1 n=1 Tax=Hyalella azteca TaxID=294128 RepID=A0A8B7P932_HYAAZ|nr:protein strawberry notch homolog 1 [Hyalella azteca]